MTRVEASLRYAARRPILVTSKGAAVTIETLRFFSPSVIYAAGAKARRRQA